MGFSTGEVIQLVLAMNDKIEKKNNKTVDLLIKCWWGLAGVGEVMNSLTSLLKIIDFLALGLLSTYSTFLVYTSKYT